MTRTLPGDVDQALRDLVQVLARLMGYPQPPVPGRTKLCMPCGRVKPLGEFSIDRARRDGLAYNCRSCRKEARVRAKRSVS